jgi:hypothetical protein
MVELLTQHKLQNGFASAVESYLPSVDDIEVIGRSLSLSNLIAFRAGAALRLSVTGLCSTRKSRAKSRSHKEGQTGFVAKLDTFAQRSLSSELAFAATFSQLEIKSLVPLDRRQRP